MNPPGTNPQLQRFLDAVPRATLGERVSHLPTQLLQKMGPLLHREGAPGNWMCLAEELGVRRMGDLEVIRSKAEVHRTYPGSMLLAEWAKEEGSSVYVLLMVLNKIGRFDCVQELVEGLLSLSSMQLHVQVRQSGQAPVFVTVDTRSEATLGESLENVLGTLHGVDIVGPQPGLLWSTPAGQLMGKQLTLQVKAPLRSVIGPSGKDLLNPSPHMNLFPSGINNLSEAAPAPHNHQTPQPSKFNIHPAPASPPLHPAVIQAFHGSSEGVKELRESVPSCKFSTMTTDTNALSVTELKHPFSGAAKAEPSFPAKALLPLGHYENVQSSIQTQAAPSFSLASSQPSTLSTDFLHPVPLHLEMELRRRQLEQQQQCLLQQRRQQQQQQQLSMQQQQEQTHQKQQMHQLQQQQFQQQPHHRQQQLLQQQPHHQQNQLQQQQQQRQQQQQQQQQQLEQQQKLHQQSMTFLKQRVPNLDHSDQNVCGSLTTPKASASHCPNNRRPPANEYTTFPNGPPPQQHCTAVKAVRSSAGQGRKENFYENTARPKPPVPKKPVVAATVSTPSPPPPRPHVFSTQGKGHNSVSPIKNARKQAPGAVPQDAQVTATCRDRSGVGASVEVKVEAQPGSGAPACNVDYVPLSFLTGSPPRADPQPCARVDPALQPGGQIVPPLQPPSLTSSATASTFTASSTSFSSASYSLAASGVSATASSAYPMNSVSTNASSFGSSDSALSSSEASSVKPESNRDVSAIDMEAPPAPCDMSALDDGYVGLAVHEDMDHDYIAMSATPQQLPSAPANVQPLPMNIRGPEESERVVEATPSRDERRSQAGLSDIMEEGEENDHGNEDESDEYLAMSSCAYDYEIPRCQEAMMEEEEEEHGGDEDEGSFEHLQTYTLTGAMTHAASSASMGTSQSVGDSVLPETRPVRAMSLPAHMGGEVEEEDEEVVCLSEDRASSQSAPTQYSRLNHSLSASQLLNLRRQSASSASSQDSNHYDCIQESSEPPEYPPRPHPSTPPGWRRQKSCPQLQGSSPSLDLDRIRGWCPKETEQTIRGTMSKFINEDGNFVVWRMAGHFVISVTHMRDIRHYRVYEKQEGGVTHYHLFEEGFSSPSLGELVEHYMREELKAPSNSSAPLVRFSHIQLKHPLRVKYVKKARRK